MDELDPRRELAVLREAANELRIEARFKQRVLSLLADVIAAESQDDIIGIAFVQGLKRARDIISDL